MSTLLHFGRDISGLNAEAPQFPTDIFTATLTVGADSSITVPNNAKTWTMYVRLNPAGWAWCSRNGTASVPDSGTFSASVSEIIVGNIEYKRTVYAGDVINFISPNTTCNIEVAFFQSSYL